MQAGCSAALCFIRQSLSPLGAVTGGKSSSLGGNNGHISAPCTAGEAAFVWCFPHLTSKGLN